EAAFAADLERAFDVAAREPVLVTFGIPATAPETTLGYVKRGERLGERLHRVARFTEKPDLENARRFVGSGESTWNSGMFVWGKRAFMDALAAGRPAIAQAFRGLSFAATETAAFERMLADRFPGVESVSVDYAVLEGAANVVTIDAAFDW